jgi:biotin transport system substrate-specific component
MSAAAVNPPLALRLWPAAGAGIVRPALLALAGAALLTLSAKVSVPFHPVPMTLQTLVVLLLGLAYGPRLAVASVALYVAQGAIGLPVFTNTPPQAPGLAYLAGPTGGFLAGFALAAAIAGFAARAGLERRPLRLLAALVLADAALLAVGWAWLAFGIGFGPARAFAAGVAPFLLSEGVKVALAAALVPAASAALSRIRP